MECPYCHKDTSKESKLCVHCGKNVYNIFSQTKHVIQPKSCPVCHIQTSIITLADIELDFCNRCSGIWFDKKEINQFEKNLTEKDIINKVISILDKLSPQENGKLLKRGAYIKCPICNEFMIHKNYHEISGVILDQCMEHGIWAEKDDIAKILNFILSGDLNELIEKSLDRQQEELKQKIRLLESEQAVMKSNITRNRLFSRAHFILDFLGFT